MTPAEILDACRHSPGVRRESRCYPEPRVFVDAPCRACAEAAIAVAVAEEREACAVLASDHVAECEGIDFGVGGVIRARGGK